MKKKLLSRRTFVRNTTAGAVGISMTAGGVSSLYAFGYQRPDKPALLGGTPVRSKGSELGSKWPLFDDSDIGILVDAYKNKNWSEFRIANDEICVQFQNEYAKFMGVNYCALTNSGTDALEAAQRAFEIGPGDEVITQTNTFIATAQTTFNLFALPILIDSDPETFMINADLIEEHITPNTRAIMPVHIGGSAANMDKILAIAKKHNLVVIEDACQAVMGEWRGKKLGSIGDLGCFSFQMYKPLAAGEGGAVVGNDEYLMAKAGGYVNNGRDPRKKGRTFPGSNFRPSVFQSANLTAQFRRLEQQTAVREENILHLEKLLSEIKGVRPTGIHEGQTRRGFYHYHMIYDKEHFKGLPKSRFQEAMRAEGISTGNGIDSNLHLDPFIETYLNHRSFRKIFSKERLDKYREEIRCPVNERIGKETGLFLGHRVFLGSKKDMEDIVTAIVKIQKNAESLL